MFCSDGGGSAARDYRQFIEHGQKFCNEAITKMFAETVVPLSDLDDVVFCFRS